MNYPSFGSFDTKSTNQYDDYPLYVDGFETFRRQFDHVFTPYKVIEHSHGCHSISIAWEANYTSLF
jgi:hypothetical protein